MVFNFSVALLAQSSINFSSEALFYFGLFVIMVVLLWLALEIAKSARENKTRPNGSNATARITAVPETNALPFDQMSDIAGLNHILYEVTPFDNLR